MYLVLLLWRCVPAFRVNLIDVPLVIGRNRDIEFPSWTAITLKGPVVLGMTSRRVSRWWGAAGRADRRFRPRVQSYVLFWNFYIFELLWRLWKTQFHYFLLLVVESSIWYSRCSLFFVEICTVALMLTGICYNRVCGLVLGTNERRIKLFHRKWLMHADVLRYVRWNMISSFRRQHSTGCQV